VALLLPRREDWLYVVNVDNDNLLTDKWLEDAHGAAQDQLAHMRIRRLASRDGLARMRKLPLFSQWSSKNCGVTGRMGLPFKLFEELGGYDLKFLAMGFQDIDLKNRAAILGAVDLKRGPWCGFSLPNDREAAEDMMSTMKKRNGGGYSEAERKAKAKNTGSSLTWEQQNIENQKRAKLRGKGIDKFKVNQGDAPIGNKVRRVGPVETRAGSDRPEGALARSPEAAIHEFRKPMRFDSLTSRWIPVKPPGSAGQALTAGRRGEPEVSRAGSDSPPWCADIVLTLGTSTLAACYPSNDFALKIKEKIWPRDRVDGDQRKEAAAVLDEGLASKAIRDIIGNFNDALASKKIHVVFLDCASLMAEHGRSGHVGTHGATSKRIALHPGATPLAKQFADIKWRSRHVKVLACHCNAGEYQSVAVAEFCRRAMDMEATVINLCSERWGDCNLCDYCPKCDVACYDKDREYAVRVWRRLCWG
jgi:hypothetical protein